MPSFHNLVFIEGRLTKDPEVKDTPTPLTTLSIAHNTNHKNDDGEWKQKAHYFDVTAWRHEAEKASLLHSGQLVGIQGRLEHDQYEAKDGTKRSTVRIVATKIEQRDLPTKAQAALEF